MNESSKNANTCFLPAALGIALITINAIVCVLGSLGNLLLCLAIPTNSRLRRASNYLLFSLAIADLIVTLICEPLFIEAIIQRTFWRTYDCKAGLRIVLSTLSYLSCATSVLHMVAISLDRFVAVAFPLRHKNFMEKYGLQVMLIVSWSVPIFKVILLLVFWRAIPWAYYSTSPFLLFGTFVFSYFLICFFYFLTVVFLLRHKRKRKQLSRARNVSFKLTSRMEVRVSCALAIAIGIFSACWVPVITIMIATMIGKPLTRPNGPLDLCLRTLALSNSAMNFLIYSAKIRDFKEAYVDIFRKLFHL